MLTKTTVASQRWDTHRQTPHGCDMNAIQGTSEARVGLALRAQAHVAKNVAARQSQKRNQHLLHPAYGTRPW